MAKLRHECQALAKSHNPQRNLAPTMQGPVLLMGASGFVGRHVYPVLRAAGYDVRCASRRPSRVCDIHPAPPETWVAMDVTEPSTYREAMKGCRAIVYLVHRMAQAGDYGREEQQAALDVAGAAAAMGVQRIVYLGGVEPCGETSRHLHSRLQTGRLLRKGKVPTVELRAGMIMGVGSESWKIVRDLSMRLPVLPVPAWGHRVSEPVAIQDVVQALVHALRLPKTACGCYDLPGPERLSATEILQRVARLRGHRPHTLSLPFLGPKLSSVGVSWLTRADPKIARELLHGMSSDLVGQEASFWPFLGEGYTPMSFDRAARIALEQEERELPLTTLIGESLLQRFSPAWPGKV